jgi:hypothetical protein
MAASWRPAIRTTDASVKRFLATTSDEQERADAYRLCAMMQDVTGELASDEWREVLRGRHR